MKPPETGRAQYARKRAKRTQRAFWFTAEELTLLFDLTLTIGTDQRDVLMRGLRALKEQLEP